MAAALTPRPESPTEVHSIGDLWLVTGALRFSGRYITGGEVMSGMPTIPGLRTVLAAILTEPRGYSLEYIPSSGKIAVYSAARTEHAEAEYDAAISGDTNITATFILV